MHGGSRSAIWPSRRGSQWQQPGSRTGQRGRGTRIAHDFQSADVHLNIAPTRDGSTRPAISNLALVFSPSCVRLASTRTPAVKHGAKPYPANISSTRSCIQPAIPQLPSTWQQTSREQRRRKLKTRVASAKLKVCCARPCFGIPKKKSATNNGDFQDH